MKAGSLVECVNNNGYQYKMVKLTMNKVYTIREIVPKGTKISIGNQISVDSVLLEEIKNDNWDNSTLELSYRMERFRELLPPMEAEIKELLTQPELQPK